MPSLRAKLGGRLHRLGRKFGKALPIENSGVASSGSSLPNSSPENPPQELPLRPLPSSTESESSAPASNIIVHHDSGKGGDTQANSFKIPAQNKAFELALHKVTEDLNPTERGIFKKAYQDISLENTIHEVKKLEASDAGTRIRRGGKSLEPAIRVLEQFMASMTIGIQQSPEISSLVIGGVRLVIDLVAKFVQFYAKLSLMIIQLADYLQPLESYNARSNQGDVVQKALVDVYYDLVKFFREARLVFVDPGGNVKKVGHLRVFLRVQWQPFEDRFGEICSSFKHHLEVLLHASQLQLLLSTSTISQNLGHLSGEVDLEHERIRLKEQREERREFLTWIPAIDYEESFNDLIKQRHPETGNWILNEFEFEIWMKQPGSSLLWCFGKPGAGKSVLASVVLDYVTTYELNDPSICVIFAYYNYRFPDQHDLAVILGSFIRQLCSKIKDLPPNVQSFFREHHQNDRTPNSDDMKPVFFELVYLFSSKVIVIIDALDECQSGSQSAILDFVEDMSCYEAALIKVFITSRKEDYIKEAFDKFPVIEIDSDIVNGDIRIFLQDEINRREKRGARPRLRLGDRALKHIILNTLASKANGMFLWAKLQLDWVCAQGNDYDIRRELDCLPPTLYETYDRILERINEKPPSLQELAQRIFMWTFYAERPLEFEELREAVAIDATLTKYDDLKERLYHEDVIMSIVGSFFFLEGEPGENRYLVSIHYSVQEYFTNSYLKTKGHLSHYYTDPQEAHSRLALSCITYLQLDIFAQGPCPDLESQEERCEVAQLAAYSSFFFDEHVNRLLDIPRELFSQICQLLNSDSSHIAALMQCRCLRGEPVNAFYDEFFFTYPLHVNALTVIYSTSLYNLPQISGIDTEWSKLPLPPHIIHSAVMSGPEAAVSRLLDSKSIFDIDIEQEDANETTPLYHAIKEQNLNIIKMLLDAGADVNSLGGRVGTTLVEAAYTQNIDVVELLLRYGADVEGESAAKALETACTFSALKIIQMLFESGASISPQAIEHACWPDVDDTILEFLLEYGEADDITPMALSATIQADQYERFILLLDHGAVVTPDVIVEAWPKYIKLLLERRTSYGITAETLREAEQLWERKVKDSAKERNIEYTHDVQLYSRTAFRAP